MTQQTQQTPSNPAIDFANMVLAETDNAREIIDLLHDIAQGQRQNSTTRDRINASRILLDRGLGKCPKQPLDIDTDTESAESDNHKNHSSDNPQIDSPSEPESPTLVTQLDQSLHDQLGPPPTVHNPQSTKDSPPSTIHHAIQKHILEITDNGRTVMTALRDIYRAPDGDPKVKDSHRVTAGRMLLDRILGTGRALETRTPEKKPYVRPVRQIDPEKLAKVRAKVQRMKDEGILTPNYDSPGPPITVPEIPEGFDPTPYLKEASEKFEADIKMTLERQKKWPAIEERRRKKLARIYPSHSEDGKPPEP